MLLLKNGDIYSPEHLGKKDILIASGKVVAIEDTIEKPAGIECTVIDLGMMKVIPGIVDGHVHIAGAGGEAGPSSRTPEMQLSHMLEGAVTTVVGCQGTDGFTRNVESVLMKAKSLRQNGVSAWIYTGAYQIPTPTITGDVGRDIALIDEVIGVGEISLSDHRSSLPTDHELARLAEHARVGGMLGGKAGIINIHMGDAKNPFAPLHRAVEISELNYKQFLPTHCNRNDYIFEDAKEYGKKGYVDLTASSYPYFPDIEIKPSQAIAQLLESGVPIEHITMSSDGNGSLPDYDDQGNLRQLEIGYPSSILREILDAEDEGMPLSTALKVATSSIADALKLPKGRINVGMDADIAVVDGRNLHHLFALGQQMVKEGEIIKSGPYGF